MVGWFSVGVGSGVGLVGARVDFIGAEDMLMGCLLLVLVFALWVWYTGIQSRG